MKKAACLSCGKRLTSANAYAHPTSGSGLQSRCKQCDNAVRAIGVGEVVRMLARGEKLPTVRPRGTPQTPKVRTWPSKGKGRCPKFIRDEAGNLVRLP